MTMSEGALDLSISSYDVTSQRVSRLHDQVSSDSGRASSDSTLSDVHEEVKARLRASPHLASLQSAFLGGGNPISSRSLGMPQFPQSVSARSLSEHSSKIQLAITSSASPQTSPHVNQTVTSSNPSSPGQAEAISGDEDAKPTLLGDRISDPRVGPMRPFKMFPVDPFNMYSNPLMAGAGGTLPPSPMSLQSFYDSASPVGFPTFPLTPLTSHLLQRKRRSENRDSSASTSTTSTTSTTVNSSSGSGIGDLGVISGSSRVSTSSPVSSKEDSNGSDGEKRAKSSLDVKKDEAYWDRRRKNNEAAKRSRDARRQKEEEIAMRAAYLEQENLKLRAQVAILKNETAKLHYMLYNRI